MMSSANYGTKVNVKTPIKAQCLTVQAFCAETVRT